LQLVHFLALIRIGHKLFDDKSLKVWILEVGQDIVSLAAMGAIIASFI
jgi:anti-sigma-K factor RskA